jgi:peptide/nickel transport system ATP-binding protein
MVRHISDRVAVMYLGKLVEVGPADAVFDRPLHPYTRALVSAIPVADPDAPAEPVPLRGEVPDPAAPPPGCRFHPRCPFGTELCTRVEPELRAPDPDVPTRVVACHHAETITP